MPIDWISLSVFVLLFVLITVLGFLAGRWRRGDLDLLHEWGLAGGRFGTLVTWFLLGGDLYTAYTFIAVPALMFGAGAIGFFAIPYSIMAYPFVFAVFPRLWSVARENGYITAADFVRGRYGSRWLALAVAVTGIVATMPYIALQLVGIQVVIAALGVEGSGWMADLPLIIAFVILAAFTYTSGLRAPAAIAIVKDTLIWIAVIAAVVAIPLQLGGYGKIFAAIPQAKLLLAPGPANALLPYSAYFTLALGSALALFLYPHAMTGVLSASSRGAISRNAALLPAYSFLLGLIALGPKKSEEPYTPTDLRMLQSVAVQTGLTLEVAELVRTLADQAAHRERMDREIEIAREVQQRLFPQDIPCIPGVDLAGRCRPALEVGGDYYDLIEMEAGHLGFAIGDVSGKGISAALIMASLRASLRGLILDDPGDLARMMQKVSHLVYEASSSSRYATFFFATLNPRTREFRYVNAGHNPPVLVKQASGTLQRLEDGGPVVGMLPFADYEAQSVTLEPGDLLIAYTDGISEAMTAADEEWGESRMLAAIPPQSSASALEVLNGIFLAADAFTAGAEQHDDMTLLVMRVKT